MKKTKIIILITIAILVIIGILLIIFNNKNTDKGDTKYNYRIDKRLVSFISSDRGPLSMTSQYYEVYLNNNEVEFKEDFMDFTDANSEKNYSGKLISSKELTEEEKNELEEFLNKIIKENKTKHVEGENIGIMTGTGYYYYTISNNNIDGIILDSEEEIKRFERIVN